jgi:hypothetical protein
MARQFAKRMQSGSGGNLQQQIKEGYKRATLHTIDEKSLRALVNLYNTAYSQFENDPEKTCEMMGEMNDDNNPQTAALTVVANAILNLDEVVTKN